MRALFFSIAVLLSAGTVACETGTACTEIYVYGLTVTVEEEDGTPICDAEVTATDGSYRETLQATPGVCGYAGAGERAGTYLIRAERAGFQSAEIPNIVVTRDECHVEPEAVALTLTSTIT